eukprot:m.692305 g.692305  ORF g.692305 m.692305 type:complete len:77 (+) comp22862_c0_seq3:133-363(+)
MKRTLDSHRDHRVSTVGAEDGHLGALTTANETLHTELRTAKASVETLTNAVAASNARITSLVSALETLHSTRVKHS